MSSPKVIPASFKPKFLNSISLILRLFPEFPVDVHSVISYGVSLGTETTVKVPSTFNVASLILQVPALLSVLYAKNLI